MRIAKVRAGRNPDALRAVFRLAAGVKGRSAREPDPTHALRGARA